MKSFYLLYTVLLALPLFYFFHNFLYSISPTLFPVALLTPDSRHELNTNNLSQEAEEGFTSEDTAFNKKGRRKDWNKFWKLCPTRNTSVLKISVLTPIRSKTPPHASSLRGNRKQRPLSNKVAQPAWSVRPVVKLYS